jgi:P27 family predicted phage terminase small subunit
MMPPAELLDEAKVEWGRIYEQLTSLGLLTKIDRGALAACCQAFGRAVVAERAIGELAKRDKVFQGLVIKTKNGNMIQNPLVGIANKAWSDYVRYAAEFGMTPSARSRINTPTPNDEEDPAEAYLG